MNQTAKLWAAYDALQFMTIGFLSKTIVAKATDFTQWSVSWAAQYKILPQRHLCQRGLFYSPPARREELFLHWAPLVTSRVEALVSLWLSLKYYWSFVRAVTENRNHCIPDAYMSSRNPKSGQMHTWSQNRRRNQYYWSLRWRNKTAGFSGRC